MPDYRVQKAAAKRLDEIYLYSRERWGDEQAERYLRGLFEEFENIVAHRVVWRDVPKEFGVDGFFCRHRHHYIYWRLLSDGVVGIVTILHERMHQIGRLRDDLSP